MIESQLLVSEWSSNILGLAFGDSHFVPRTDTASVAAIVAVSEGKAAGQIWWSLAHLSFPYYGVSAGVTTMVEAVSSHMGRGLALAVFPVMYGVHRSYRLYFRRMAETPRPEVLVRAAGA